MRSLLIATGNAGKAKEFGEILAPLGWACVSLKTCGREVPEPEETGATFRANACLKATYYARALGMYALADDSGLAVDALGGKPGVHSARWAEMNRLMADVGCQMSDVGCQMSDGGCGVSQGREGRDRANNRVLLAQMKDVPDSQRTARFMCVLALADPEGRVLLTAEGTVEGVLLREGRGGNGFGYDPLFFVTSHGKTTAELSAEEKHAISHRGNATRALLGLMREVGLVFEGGASTG